MTALRKGRPDAEITWLVGPWSEALALRYSVADHVITQVPALSQYQRAAGDRLPGMYEEYRQCRKIGEDRFDLLITTSNMDPWVLFLAACVQPVAWIGMNEGLDRYRCWAEKINLDYEPDVYEAASQLRIAEVLGCSGPSRLMYSVTEEERTQARNALQNHGLHHDQPFLVVAPGSGWKGKNWPSDRFAS
ncbi:MAG: hypothetical protein KDL31_13690, partial [Kiritimatiellae bacterium]|nr:hypothetical protein [Kiritimatiellia bacterium]